METTLLDPQQALDTISRDELVNLLVDDALTRAQEEMTQLNMACNEADKEALRLLRKLYADARHAALLDLEPALRAFRTLVRVAGHKAKVEVYYLPEPKDCSMSSWQIYDSKDNKHSRRENVTTLCEVLTALVGNSVEPGMVSYPNSLDYTVNLGVYSNNAAPSLNATVPVTLTLRTPLDFTAWQHAFREAQVARNAYARLAEAIKDPVKLQRTALASLTREALRKKGVVLEGGLPVAPLQLPG